MNIPYIDLKQEFKDHKKQIMESIEKVLESGQFILGPAVKELEERLSKDLGENIQASACSSGTDAILISLLALDLKPGDEIITSAFSFPAAVEIAIILGYKPVLVDIDINTFNIDINKIEEAITDKTKVIIPIDLYGVACDYEKIEQIAKKHNIRVIEDAAQSIGGSYKNKKCGTFGDIAITSFYPAKPLGCYGEGGMIFSKDAKLMEKIRKITVHGDLGRYTHNYLGINGRLETIQAAILLEKLKFFWEDIEKRQEKAENYNKRLSEFVNTQSIPNDTKSSFAQYTIRVKNRDKLRDFMSEKNIPSAVHYPRTLAEQIAFKDFCKFTDLHYSDIAAKEVVSLPFYPNIPVEHQNYIIDAIIEFTKSNN